MNRKNAWYKMDCLKDVVHKKSTIKTRYSICLRKQLPFWDFIFHKRTLFKCRERRQELNDPGKQKLKPRKTSKEKEEKEMKKGEERRVELKKWQARGRHRQTAMEKNEMKREKILVERK